MTENPARLWIHAVVSEFIEGSVTAFLVVSGGNTASQVISTVPEIGLQMILLSIAMGGLVGACRYLQHHPLPNWFVQPKSVK